jgi:hypothetical protein
MRDNHLVTRSAASSVRVSARTSRRVGELARRLGASTLQQVIDRALDALERRIFWEGFDQEAPDYLKRYPAEAVERERFGHPSPAGLGR